MTHYIYKVARIILVIVVLATTVVPQTALALPRLYFAVGGSSCDLPDGTGGLVTNDGHTCCPTNVVNKGTFAADPTQCLYAKYINPTINLLATLVGVVVVIAIIYGAIEYITSGGDAQRTAAGKKRIIEALIGLVAFMLLYTFLKFLLPGGFGG